VKSGENGGLDTDGSENRLNGISKEKGSTATGEVDFKSVGRRVYGKLPVAFPRVALV